MATTGPSGDMLGTHLDAISRAARILRDAKRVLIATGAGMSADSGIPTYRDEDGRWRKLEPFASRGIVPAEVAHPPGFRERPEQAWGFHEWIRRRVATSTPHAGYDVLARWIRDRFEAFVLTTNIDGYHLRSGAPSSRVCERYGSQWELQCLERCRDEYWSEPAVPLCTLDDTTLLASNFPRCPFCDALARPRIQMAFDEQFLVKDVDHARLDRFRAEEPDVLLVIGTTLWLSWPDGAPRPRHVISVNPNLECHAPYADGPSLVAITLGARDALVGIDWMSGLL